MRIAIVGGGPGGLYFATLMKTLDPAHEITVWERNAPDDTFGFGVVFSDETLGGIEGADRVVHDRMERSFARWTDIDVALTDVAGDGERHRSPSAVRASPRCPARSCSRSCRSGRRARRRGPLPAEAPDPDELRAIRTTWCSPPTGWAPRCARSTPTASARPSTAATTSTSGSAPTSSSRRSSSSSTQTEWGTMQIHGYPYSDAGSTFIVEMHEDVWRRAGFDPTEARPSRPGSPTSTPSSGSRRSSPTSCRDTRSSPTTPSGSTSTPSATSALARRQRRAARRRRPHRALLDRLRHQAGHGGRPRAGRLPARAPDPRGSARGLRDRAQAGRRVDAARGAGVDGVVREHRDVRRPGAGAVRLQPAHPLPSDHLRQPRGARRRVRGADGGGVRPLAGRRRDRAGDVPADPHRRARAEEPRDALPHGHVRRHGRDARRVPPGATSAARRSAAPDW